VVALSPFFRAKAAEYAHVLLPISPFTETPGTFISTEGRVQTFHATVKPLGDSRPAWKVLRVLGGMLGLEGFGYETAEEVRAECLKGREVSSLLSNGTSVALQPVGQKSTGLQRVADVPIYFADSLVRRSPPLQKTADARPPRARMNAKLMAELGLAQGDRVRIRLGEGEVELPVCADERIADRCVRVAAAHATTAALGPMFGELSVMKAAAMAAA
jgi:NADH-quinone oxidoreductase subunit G